MQWSRAPVNPGSRNPNNPNGLLPVPILWTQYPNTQTSYQDGRPCSLLGQGPEYTSHNHQRYNRNLSQRNDGFRPTINQSNDGNIHTSRNASRWNPRVRYEYDNRRQQPNKHNPALRCEIDENLIATEDVKMKKLPFFDVISTLLQVNVVKQGSSASHYNFAFKPKELENILSNKNDLPYKVQLRICKLDCSSEQMDYYPALLQVAVNNNLCILPGIDSIPRGPAVPVNITFMCNLMGRNDVAVRNADNQNMENLKVCVQLVKKLTSQDLIDRLKAKNPTKLEDTASQIKEKLHEDQTGDEIASTTLPCSLLCPLSKTRMTLPCRASSCSHFQCFDAVTYLQMNELKPKWSCPVCSEPAIYDHLQIDGYFKSVVEQNISSDKIILLADGTWKPVQSANKRQLQCIDDVGESFVDGKVSTPNRTVDLDSDDDISKEDCQGIIVQNENEDHNTEDDTARDISSSVVIITLSDDESYINSPQTNNHMFRFCSTPQTSSRQTRRSSLFNASQVQATDTTQASQSFASSTPHSYTLRSLKASQASTPQKRLSRKKSPKTRYSTNSSINSCGNDSIICCDSRSLMSTFNSHGNRDSESLRTESRISISSENDSSDAVSHQKSKNYPSDAVPHQGSYGRRVSSHRSTMVLRSAVQRPETKRLKSRRGISKK